MWVICTHDWVWFWGGYCGITVAVPNSAPLATNLTASYHTMRGRGTIAVLYGNSDQLTRWQTGARASGCRTAVQLVYVIAWLGVKNWDKYHEYCSGSGKIARGEAASALCLSYYNTRGFYPKFHNQPCYHRLIPYSRAFRYKNTQRLLLGGWALIRESRSQGFKYSLGTCRF